MLNFTFVAHPPYMAARTVQSIVPQHIDVKANQRHSENFINGSVSLVSKQATLRSPVLLYIKN